MPGTVDGPTGAELASTQAESGTTPSTVVTSSLQGQILVRFFMPSNAVSRAPFTGIVLVHADMQTVKMLPGISSPSS